MGQTAAVRVPAVIEPGGLATRRDVPWCPIEMETLTPTSGCRSDTVANRRVGAALAGASGRRTENVRGLETDGTH